MMASITPIPTVSVAAKIFPTWLFPFIAMIISIYTWVQTNFVSKDTFNVLSQAVIARLDRIEDKIDHNTVAHSPH